MIPDAAGKTLVPIIERKVTPDSIVYFEVLLNPNRFGAAVAFPLLSKLPLPLSHSIQLTG